MSADDREFAAQSLGVRYEAPSTETLDRRLRALDRPGRHLWIMTAMWHVADPEESQPGGGPVFLDAENMLGLAGIGCFKCEAEYSRRLAGRPCRGSIR